MFVYLITDGEYVKIGQSVDPEKRLSQLQTGSPRLLELCACIPESEVTELELHQQFRNYRANGEWFEIAPEVETYLKWAKKTFPYIVPEPEAESEQQEVVEIFACTIAFVRKHGLKLAVKEAPAKNSRPAGVVVFLADVGVQDGQLVYKEPPPAPAESS